MSEQIEPYILYNQPLGSELSVFNRNVSLLFNAERNQKIISHTNNLNYSLFLIAIFRLKISLERYLHNIEQKKKLYFTPASFYKRLTSSPNKM